VGGVPIARGRAVVHVGEGVGELDGRLDRLGRGGRFRRPAHERGGDQARRAARRRVVSGAGGDDVEIVADEPPDRGPQPRPLGQPEHEIVADGGVGDDVARVDDHALPGGGLDVQSNGQAAARRQLPGAGERRFAQLPINERGGRVDRHDHRLVDVIALGQRRVVEHRPLARAGRRLVDLGRRDRLGLVLGRGRPRAPDVFDRVGGRARVVGDARRPGAAA
jgi:hypothetical protein